MIIFTNFIVKLIGVTKRRILLSAKINLVTVKKTNEFHKDVGNIEKSEEADNAKGHPLKYATYYVNIINLFCCQVGRFSSSSFNILTFASV